MILLSRLVFEKIALESKSQLLTLVLGVCFSLLKGDIWCDFCIWGKMFLAKLAIKKVMLQKFAISFRFWENSSCSLSKRVLVFAFSWKGDIWCDFCKWDKLFHTKFALKKILLQIFLSPSFFEKLGFKASQKCQHWSELSYFSFLRFSLNYQHLAWFLHSKQIVLY